MSVKFNKLALALFWVLAGSSLAAAHCFPDHAEPRVGAVLAEPPEEVRIWFTEKLKPAFSTLRVLDDTGIKVDKGNGRVSEEDRQLLRADLPSLPQGVYTVEWKVLSVDGHGTAGRFTFTVR